MKDWIKPDQLWLLNLLLDRNPALRQAYLDALSTLRNDVSGLGMSASLIIEGATQATQGGATIDVSFDAPAQKDQTKTQALAQKIMAALDPKGTKKSPGELKTAVGVVGDSSVWRDAVAMLLGERVIAAEGQGAGRRIWKL
jgi:hypothetical protein